MSRLNLGTPVSNYSIPAYEWLIEGLIPLKRVVLLGGVEKCGKSQFICALAAAVTVPGTELAPDVKAAKNGNVLIISTERTDEYAPRIEAAGADVSRVNLVDAGRKGSYDWNGIFASLQILSDDSGVALIVLDHIGDLSEKEIKSPAKIGEIVNRLSEQAERLGCTIVIVSHLNKSQTNVQNVRGAFAGSNSWLRKVSDAWAAVLIKEGVGVIEHAFGSQKSTDTVWEYHITTYHTKMLRDAEGNSIKTSKLTVANASKVSFLEAFGMSSANRQNHESTLDAAFIYLNDKLKDGAKVLASEMLEGWKGQGEKRGSERTLRSAKAVLGVLSTGGPGSVWYLPTVEAPAPAVVPAPTAVIEAPVKELKHKKVAKGKKSKKKSAKAATGATSRRHTLQASAPSDADWLLELMKG